MANIVLESQPDINADLTGEQIELQDFPTEEMLVNMGPQHPATHGVLRVVLRTDGEMVLEAVPHIGYLHRCAEKIGETLAPYQYIPYTDRMDYLAGMNNNLAFALAVEKLTGLETEISDRARLIRVIFAELNRIASHLVSFGTYGLDLGAFTPFLYAFREREWILDLFESTCGARLTYSYITLGGVHDDLPDRFIDVCTEFLDYFEPKIPEYNDLLSFNHIFVKRTANVGVISAEDAIDYGAERAGSTWFGCEVGLAQGAPGLRLRGLRFRHPRRHGSKRNRRRLLGSLLRPHLRDGAVGANHPAGHGEASRHRGADRAAQKGQDAQAAERRHLLRDRKPAWSARFLCAGRMARPSPPASRPVGRVSATCQSPRRYAAM